MASSSDSWMKEYNEAVKITNDISGMISEHSLFPALGSETQRHMSAIRRKITILGTRLDTLDSSLPMPGKQLKDTLLGPAAKKPDAMSRTIGMDNYGIVGLQRKIMKEQDEGLEKLEETVISTKHIALAVHEELDLHTRLIDDLDEHVEITDSRLQRVRRNLASLNKRAESRCSCMLMLFAVMGIVILVVVIYLLIKYL